MLNALGCVLLAVLLLPMAEAFTGIETDLTLLEWSDLNRPLLQRLSLEAPGTYAHTIAIANLAEAACRAIGANALLARVGAYYHDIGKIARPQYFVENQAKGRNPHDALAPARARRSFATTCTKGSRWPRRTSCRERLRAFITEHHGTGTISYFLDKARQTRRRAADAADSFIPARVPQSAETAVVMLADGIEAATRVLHDPTPKRFATSSSTSSAADGAGTAGRGAAHVAPNRDREGRIHARARRACITTASTIPRRQAA